MTARARWVSVVAMGSVLGIAACGGSKGTTTPTVVATPTPNPVTTAVVAQGALSNLQVLELRGVPFTTGATGTITATVDWTFSNDNVEIYLVRGTCTIEQFNNQTCPFVAFSESVSQKPEVARGSSQAAGSFTLYIGNRGPQVESTSYQVTLLSGGTTSSEHVTHALGHGASAGRWLAIVNP